MPSIMGRYLPAALFVVLAVIDLITLALAHPWEAADGLTDLFAIDALGWGRAGIIVIAFLLLFVARALARGKRQGWLLSVGLVVFSFIAALSERASRSTLLLLLGLLLGLLVLAPVFPARSDRRALVRGYIALALGFAALVGHGTVHILLHIGHADILLLEPHGLLFVLRAAAYLLLSYGVVEVLRPVLRVRDVPATERERVSAVVQQYGYLSLAYYTLGSDLSYFWSTSGRSFLAYRASRGIALMLGDPIGPADELAPLTWAFLAFCRRQDWQLAIYQASSETLAFFARDTIHAIKVGEEAVVETSTFTLQGKVGAPVRHAVARARRGGISIQCWHGEPLPEAIFAEMKRVSAEWLHAHNTHSQMGFSMGRFPADWSPNVLTCAALGPEGDVQAFVTWTPVAAGNGWTLDIMRRVTNAVPGTMEYLLAASIEWARTSGYCFMSLSLAPLANPSDDPTCLAQVAHATLARRWRISSSAQILQRSATYLHRRRLLLGNYRSLYFFKQKFQPVWQPRYLVVEDISTLPRVLIALAVAHGMNWRTVLYEAHATWHGKKASRGEAASGGLS